MRPAKLSGPLPRMLSAGDAARPRTGSRAAGRASGRLAGAEPAALVTLAHYPGQSVTTLGQTLSLTHSGAVRLADRLEADGLVRRGVAYGCRNWPGAVETRAMSCLALFGASLMVLAAARGLAVLAVLMIPLGLPLSPWLGSLSASVQHAVPAASSGEAFAWTFAAVTAGMSGGNAVAGVITQNATPQAAFLSAGALALTGASFGAVRHATGAGRACRDTGTTAGVPRTADRTSLIRIRRSVTRCTW